MTVQRTVQAVWVWVGWWVGGASLSIFVPAPAPAYPYVCVCIVCVTKVCVFMM